MRYFIVFQSYTHKNVSISIQKILVKELGRGNISFINKIVGNF